MAIREQNAVVRLGRYRGRVILMFAVVACIAMAIVLPSRKPEPAYGGHPIGYWLAGGDGTNARNPILPFSVYPDGLDTNALPYLIKALNRKASWPEKTYSWFYLKCRPSIGALLPNPLYASVIRERAADFLGKLGPAAKPAVPALIVTLRSDKEDVIRASAASALWFVGDDEPSVINALRAASSDTNVYAASVAASVLREWHH